MKGFSKEKIKHFKSNSNVVNKYYYEEIPLEIKLSNFTQNFEGTVKLI